MKLVKIFALLILVTSILFSFQNCGPSQNTGLLGSRTEGLSATEKITESAPFAYDMVIDTISYNSCVGIELNNSGIHGIKLGVNEGFSDKTGSGTVKAGLKLRSEFLTYVGKNVAPNYPSTVITSSQIQYVLQNSTANKNAYIQYAVRKRVDLSPAVDLINPGADAAVTPPRDGDVERSALSAEPVLTSLTKNVQFASDGTVLSEGPRVYNLYEAADTRPIQASFNYSNYTDSTYSIADTTALEPFGFGEAYSDRVRQRFNSSGSDKYILAVTFGNPTTGSSDYGLSSPMRPSSSDVTKAYGRGYTFRFEAAGTKAGWRNNLLKQITETNLVDNSPASGVSWSCENYVIVKSTQWNNTKADDAACAPLNSSDMQNATIAEKVQRLRRHYSETDWNVGLFYPKNGVYAAGARATQSLCLAPKTAECYLPTALHSSATNTDEELKINYDPTTECYLYAASVMGVSYTGAPTYDQQRALGRCAQFASICARTSTSY